MQICEHYKPVDLDHLNKLLRGVALKCSNKMPHSFDTEGQWMCLTCGHVGCSRNSALKCAEQHFRQSRHPLRISLSSGSIFCYQCDETYADLIANQLCELNSRQKTALAGMREFTELVEVIFLQSKVQGEEEYRRNAADRKQFGDESLHVESGCLRELEVLAGKIASYRDIVDKVRGLVETKEIEEELELCKQQYGQAYTKWRLAKEQNKKLRR